MDRPAGKPEKAAFQSFQMLKRRSLGSGLTRRVDTLFRRFAAAYGRALDRSLNVPWVSVAVLVLLSAAAAAMMYRLPAEYAPSEDRGAFFVLLRGPEGSSFEYMDGYSRRMEAILLEEAAQTDSVRRFLTRLPGSFGGGDVSSARSIILLENWSERSENDKAVAARVRGGHFPEVDVGRRCFVHGNRLHRIAVYGDDYPGFLQHCSGPLQVRASD